MTRNRLYFFTFCLASSALFFLFLPELPFWRPGSIRILFDPWDLGIYFGETDWVLGEKVLYRDIFSEYTILANLVFGAIRGISIRFEWLVAPGLPPHLAPFAGQLTFAWVWMSVAWFLFAWLVLFTRGMNVRNTWLWLSPAPVYYALYRFDLYPVLACFAFLFFLQKENHWIALFWLGICIALKGYALVLLGPLFAFLRYRVGFARAGLWCAYALLPLVLSNLAVLLKIGYAEMIFPYQYQGARTLNGESSYDALVFIVGLAAMEPAAVLHDFFAQSRMHMAFQVLLVLTGTLLRPRTFLELARAFFFVLVGFISFSPFYSPQFVLWIIPVACFLRPGPIHTWTIAFAWVSFLYFPILFDLKSPFFPAVIILLFFLRMALLFFSLRDFRESPPGKIMNEVNP